VDAGTAAAPAPVDPELVSSLEDKRRSIRQIEEQRQRELDGLKQQLSQAQLTLTPQHPTVIALQQKVDALSKPPPELLGLKAEERTLMAQIAPQIAPQASSASTSPPAAPAGNAPPRGAAPRAGPPSAAAPVNTALRSPVSEREDPALAPARGKLEAAIHRYQDVMARLDSARLELDITRTAFRHRYAVITPAEVPRGPKKPIAQLITAGSLLAAALLALLFAALADWRAGRVLEVWQIRRQLKLEVLGELEGPR
jgi:hypothetical protein